MLTAAIFMLVLAALLCALASRRAWQDIAEAQQDEIAQLRAELELARYRHRNADGRFARIVRGIEQDAKSGVLWRY